MWEAFPEELEQTVESDAELVEAVVAGDRAAYATLVGRYEKAVRAVATHVLGDYHAAEDVAQDAFVIAYEKLSTLRDASVFGTWIRRIARHRALRAARKASRSEPLVRDAEPTAESRDGRLDDRSRMLLDAVARLPEHEQRVVTLRYFDGHSVQDIAHMTGRPVGTITKQLSRAQARLRNQLKGDEK